MLARAKTVANREIQEVAGPDRLRIAGLGETRLLGVTVAAEQREAAIAYLQQAVAGKRLAVTVAAGQDPARRPLVVVTLHEGTSVNAGLIQCSLASLWKWPGSWEQRAASQDGPKVPLRLERFFALLFDTGLLPCYEVTALTRAAPAVYPDHPKESRPWTSSRSRW